MAMTMCSSELGLEYGALYVVGTAFVELGDEEPKKGRIHVLRWDPRTEELHQIGIHDVLGCLHQICDFGGRLVAAVSSSVRDLNPIRSRNPVTISHKWYLSDPRCVCIVMLEATSNKIAVITRT